MDYAICDLRSIAQNHTTVAHNIKSFACIFELKNYVTALKTIFSLTSNSADGSSFFVIELCTCCRALLEKDC